MKRIAAALSLVLAIGTVPFHSMPVFAEELDVPGNSCYYYENQGDHIVITGCSGNWVNYFPDEIEGLPVTKLSEGGCAGDTQRNSTGPDSDCMRIVSLPNGITAIPDGWFAGCSQLKTIILPETITSIGDGAFEGCDNLRDVMFQGTDAQWDTVTISASNEALENACIQTNHNRVSGEEIKFVDGEDTWSFTNVQMTEYILRDETLTHYLESSHPDAFAWFKKKKDYRISKEYKGVCAGFALSSYLASIGVLDPSDIYEGAETLHDIPFCEEAIEAVTYYFVNTLTEAMQMQSNSGEDQIYLESGAFLADMLQGRPVYLGFSVKQGMHAVVAYGVEYGEWQYNDTVYTGRILIYDNNDGDFTEESCIYFNGDFEDTYIPSYNSPATLCDFLFDPDRVPYGIGNRTSYQSTYASGDLNTDSIIDAADAASILTAAAASGSGADTGLCNGQKSAADVNNDSVFDATDAAKVLEYAAYAGSGGELEFEEYLSQ